MRMAIRCALGGVVAAALVWPPGPARAQAEVYLGAPVADVRVELEGRPVTEPEVRSLLAVGRGRPFSMADVRETIRHLFVLGRYEDIAADVSRTPAGLVVTFRLVPARVVTRVAFRGNTGLAHGDLQRVVGERHGEAPRPARAGAVRDTLLAHYADLGYFRATVGVSVEPVGASEAALVFVIDAGPRARIGQLKVEGRPPGGVRGALTALRLERGEPWNGPNVQRRRTDWLGELHARGYYEAAVEVRLERRDEDRRVDVTVDVEAGPHVTIVFKGDPVPESRRAELVPIAREASIDEDLLEDSKRRLETWLTSQGYWRATVEYARQVNEGEQRIVFTVATGRLYYTSEVELAGASALPRPQIESLIKTRRGSPFVRSQLDADAAAVSQAYQRQGFASVRVQPDVLRADPGTVAGIPAGAAVVRARLVVTEGPRTTIGALPITGASQLGEDVLRPLLRIRTGDPYVPAAVRAARAQLSLAYLNRGFRTAIVNSDTLLSSDQTRADVTFQVVEGPLALVDRVIIVGNTRTSTRTILREVQLAPGAPVSLEAIAESQRRLSALGLFRRVRVEDREEPGVTTRDVVVIVEEAPATSVGYGAGLEAGARLRRLDDPVSGPAQERIEFAPRGFFEIGRRNLWGKNRSVNLYARASLRQKTAGVTTQGSLGGYGFHEYRVVGTLREPRILALPADATFSAVAEQGIRSSFSFRRQALSVDVTRRRLSGVTVIGRYAFGRTETFDEQYDPAVQPIVDRLFPDIRLSSFSGALIHDTRDDVLDPTRGVQVSVTGDVAARTIGSQVGFGKVLTQGFVYRTVPGRAGPVVAFGLRVGLATGFARDVQRRDAGGQPVLDADGRPIVDHIKDLPASERFYAGGGTTVRGFALDRLGPVDPDGFPTGGNALLIANGEIRFPLWKALGGVAFLDGGNVFPLVSDMDLRQLRGSAGFGIRYKSPVGPIRVDLGFKLDRRTSLSGTRERGYVIHISIGQAF